MTVKAIATWKMSKDALELIKDENLDAKALLKAIEYIDDRMDIHTVGSYSIPNKKGFLQLDGAFMDSKGHVGSIIEASHINHPATVAYELSFKRQNCILAGNGADEYAKKTDNSYKIPMPLEGNSSNNHDTFAMIIRNGADYNIGISSSGRAFKHEGRVGDSPLVGSGYYCDEDGACAGTGDGEAILKGCLSKEVVTRMALGENIKEAMINACTRHNNRLDYEADYCLIALANDGSFYAYTSLNPFPFAIIEDDEVKLLVAYPDGSIKEASKEFLSQYQGD